MLKALKEEVKRQNPLEAAKSAPCFLAKILSEDPTDRRFTAT